MAPTSDRSTRERRRLSPDEARILERFKRLAPQRDALAVALLPFCDSTGSFDRAVWTRAFASDDPQTIVAVTAVTGIYEGLVNHLMEMLHVASRLAGLHFAGEGKPAGPALVEAVRSDGGLSVNQAAVLLRLYRTRNELQHASLDVEAAQVHDDVVLLQKTLGRFASSYVKWLERHDVQLLPVAR
jgi:hypothetical protein